MNLDPALVADPLFVLLAWAGGISLAAAAVTARSVVGAGFTWLAGATAILIGSWPALGGNWPAGVASLAVAVGALMATRQRLLSAIALAAGAGLFAVAAMGFGGPVLAVTATLALGGITGEMLLGHWYLVDPTMPRLALRVLAIAGIVGLVADAVAVVVTVGVPAGDLAGAAFWMLAATTLVLMVGVIGALRHPAYSGVMAATGLSYLAVLTGLAAVFIGRVLATGSGPL